MGKIRSGLRRVVKEIIKKYKDKVTTDFEKNKIFLDNLGIFESKKIRNIVAGMLVREAKKEVL
jgi:ribosomal protein S17E